VTGTPHGTAADPVQHDLPGLALSRAVVDRDAGRRTDEAWLAAAWADPASRVVRVRDGRVAVHGDEARLDLDGRPDVPDDRRLLLGTHDGVAYLAVLEDGPDHAVDGGGDEHAPSYLGLREVGALLDDLEAGLVVHAVSLANWHATHRFCPRCGEPTRVENAGHSRRCVADGSEHYPRTDPAIITLVLDDDDRLLLGRQNTWPEGRFSTLAGFVEPGESLEAAVRREVREEVGIDVDAVGYLGSQPWPFPSSLMLGFTAHARSTEVTMHDGEIADTRWYTRESMTADIASGRLHVSPSISISRRLIEHWYGGPLTENARS
jgi:NAD+ diphosphatase